jgi:ribosomal protein S15
MPELETNSPGPANRLSGGVNDLEAHVIRLSERINQLTEALNTHAGHARAHSELMTLVVRRRRLLDALKHRDPSRYEALTQRLAIKSARQTRRIPLFGHRRAGKPAVSIFRGLIPKLPSNPPGEASRSAASSAAAPTPADGKPRADAHLQAALRAARDRGQARVAEILDGEDMLSATAFAALLGISRVTINTKRQKHQILGLEGAKRGFRFPRWQIGDDGKPFPGLPALFDRIGGSPWAVYRFLVQHHPELDGLTGGDALRSGRTAEALNVAESVLRTAS